MKIKSDKGRVECRIKKDDLGRYAIIYNLYVKKKHRRNGEARRLLKQAIDLLRSRGWEGEIDIVAEPGDVTVNKDRLIDFYASMGLTVYYKS